jgi:hypothetical protein
MVLPPAGLAVRPVCESPNKEIANADPHDRETHEMSAHGTRPLCQHVRDQGEFWKVSGLEQETLRTVG